MSAIEDLLLDHVKDYQAWYFYRDEAWDVDSVKEHESKARTTLEVLREMLHHTPDFASAQTTHTWFKENYDPEEAASTLVTLCKQLIAKYSQTAEKSFQHFEASSTSKLRKALAPFTTSKSVHRNLTSPAALWPLVDTVSVGIKGVRFLDHLIIADLPGLDDTNRVRVATTQAYLQKCDVVWTIANMDRVVSSARLAEMLDRTFDQLTYANSNRIAVVCTHTDDKIAGALDDLRKRGHNVKAAKALERSVKDMNSRLTREKAKLAKVKTSDEKVQVRDKIDETEYVRNLCGYRIIVDII